MFFRQSYLQGLGHASYLVRSRQTGEAFVFDPDATVPGVPGGVLHSDRRTGFSVNRVYVASLVRLGA